MQRCQARADQIVCFIPHRPTVLFNLPPTVWSTAAGAFMLGSSGFSMRSMNEQAAPCDLHLLSRRRGSVSFGSAAPCLLTPLSILRKHLCLQLGIQRGRQLPRSNSCLPVINRQTSVQMAAHFGSSTPGSAAVFCFGLTMQLCCDPCWGCVAVEAGTSSFATRSTHAK